MLDTDVVDAVPGHQRKERILPRFTNVFEISSSIEDYTRMRKMVPPSKTPIVLANIAHEIMTALAAEE